MMPSVVLKNMVMGDLSHGTEDAAVNSSVEFVSEMVSVLLTESQLASTSFVLLR